MTTHPTPSPFPGERILTCLDWATITTDLADRVEPLLTAGGGHLLPASALQHLTVQALLASGLGVREVALGSRTSRCRAPMWLELDAGIHASLDIVHLDHHNRTATHTRALTKTIARTAALPVHEHITIAAALGAGLA